MSDNKQTGPKTPEGKKRSSLNALKHGLTARSPHALDAVAEVQEIPFDDIHEEMIRHYRPMDPVERQLVLRIARCVWRLQLSAGMEERLVETRRDALRPGTAYERILKYERLVDIHLHRAIVALERKRESTNKSTRQNETPPSVR